VTAVRSSRAVGLEAIEDFKVINKQTCIDKDRFVL
jgi:hypothetical protein